jgi:hypothetical protein
MVTPNDRTVTVFGGTGFLGRRTVRHLRDRELPVRIASTHPDRWHRQFGRDDPQLRSVQADIRDERSVADALAGAYAVVNAVSLYVEHGQETFSFRARRVCPTGGDSGASGWSQKARSHFRNRRRCREVFGTPRRRRRRRPVVQGRSISNGCTFAPPAIRGLDGSKCSRSSRFWTSARATTKASFRLLACRSATLKKASPK